MLHRIRSLPALILGASVFSLAAALTAQYGLGLKPCILCLIQRVPFVITGALGAAALLPMIGQRLARILVIVAGLTFLANSAVAFYQVGVERHWWADPGCAADDSGPVTMDILANANRAVEVPCDRPAWEWRGVTIAGLNVLWSLGLGVFTLTLVNRSAFGRAPR